LHAVKAVIIPIRDPSSRPDSGNPIACGSFYCHNNLNSDQDITIWHNKL
jgi:hypothetical protein